MRIGEEEWVEEIELEPIPELEPEPEPVVPESVPV